MTVPPPPGELSAGGRRAWAQLFAPPLAHRGLWSPQGPPENSLAAFEAACAAGYGLELDVQLTADGEAVVFHDDRLERITTAEGRVAEHAAADLAGVRLGGSDQTIPTLAQALERVAGHGLVLIELKVLGGDEGPLERRVAEVVEGYGGPFGLISFNPHAVGWFADHRPGWLRGLNSSAYHDASNWMLDPAQRQGLARLDHAAIARPHFLSLGLEALPNPYADALRAAGAPVAAWTVRSPRQWARVSTHCDAMMFEGWRP